MPCSSHKDKLIFNPKVKNTVHRVGKEAKKHKEEQSIVASSRLNSEVESTDSFSATSSDFDKKKKKKKAPRLILRK